VFLLLSAGHAFATISINLQADLLKDTNNAPIPQNSLFLLVASTQDNVFSAETSIPANASTAVGSTLGSSDDIVLFRSDLTGFGVNGVLDKGNITLDFSNPSYGGNWTQGDRLAFLWFPTLTLASPTTPAAGTRYGFYSNPTAADGSNPWITPANGASAFGLAFFTKDGSQLSPGATAANAPEAGKAILMVVPEPSSLSLALLCGGPLIHRRRRIA
jgi:hypothetical protein